jgi:hypothetical protein
MQALTDIFGYFIYVLLELTVLILVLNSLVCLVFMHIPQNKIKTFLSGHGILRYIAGALLGAATPLWSFTTIPITFAFIEADFPFGAVMSFTIASPLLNPIIMAKITSILGVSYAQIYFLSILILSVVSGIFLDKRNCERFIRPYIIAHHDTLKKEVPPTLKLKVARAFHTAWEDYKHIFWHMIIGVALGTAIYALIPQSLIQTFAGENNPLAIPAAAFVGIPYFLRAETAVAISSSLISKGMSYGAAIALIIGGAGIDIPAISLLAGIFEKRLVIFYAVTIFIIAVTVGMIFQFAPVF